MQTDLRDSEKRIEELRERLKDAEDVLSRVTVRAAQDGTVVSSTVHSTGQVVRPGEVLMEIVPSSDRLLVEAKIDPRDIEYIALKAQAKVRFIGLPRRTTPTIMGTVSYVSADSIVENNVTFYKVRISITASEMKKLGIAAVSPGMPTEVMVIAGRRTLMDYLVSPITSVTERALREKN